MATEEALVVLVVDNDVVGVVQDEAVGNGRLDGTEGAEPVTVVVAVVVTGG